MALALALVSSLSTAGCLHGGDGSEARGPRVEERELRRPGELSLCSDMSRPPLEYRSADGTRRGFEVELMTEIARRLGLQPVWVDVERTGLVDALVAGRCDAAASTLPVRRDGGGTLGRIAAAAYVAVPISVLVRNGERARLATGLCGRRIGTFVAGYEGDLLREYDRACTAEGRERLTIVPVESTPEALDHLRAGRVDAVLAEHPVNDWYSRRETDRFDVAWVLGDEVVRWAVGFGIERTGLYAAVRSTLLELHEDGTFRALVEEWGLQRTGAIALPLP